MNSANGACDGSVLSFPTSVCFGIQVFVSLLLSFPFSPPSPEKWEGPNAFIRLLLSLSPFSLSLYQERKKEKSLFLSTNKKPIMQLCPLFSAKWLVTTPYTDGRAKKQK